MKGAFHHRDSHALHPAARVGWHIIFLALGLLFSGVLIVGCVFRSNVLTTPGNPVDVGRLFPSALLAEPIQLRAGYTHTTQEFQIKNRSERWAVALGFVRSDTNRPPENKKDEAYDVCWVRGAGKGIGYTSCSKQLSQGYSLQWELLNKDGRVTAHFVFDSVIKDGGGTYAGDAITKTLSGFAGQSDGYYRLRLKVLRDSAELDFLRPHILVDRPFFSSKAID